MQDELEEGYFDAQGTYIWNKKDASEIKDSWLDSIDWVKVSEELGVEFKWIFIFTLLVLLVLR